MPTSDDDSDDFTKRFDVVKPVVKDMSAFEDIISVSDSSDEGEVEVVALKPTKKQKNSKPPVAASTQESIKSPESSEYVPLPQDWDEQIQRKAGPQRPEQEDPLLRTMNKELETIRKPKAVLKPPIEDEPHFKPALSKLPPPVPPPKVISLSSSSEESGEEDEDEDFSKQQGFPLTLKLGNSEKIPIRCRPGETLQAILDRVYPQHANLNLKFDGKKLDKTKPWDFYKWEEDDALMLS